MEAGINTIVMKIGEKRGVKYSRDVMNGKEQYEMVDFVWNQK